MGDFSISGHIKDSVGSDNMGASFTTTPVSISQFAGFSVEISVDNTGTASTGTAAGTFEIQISNSNVDYYSLHLPDSSTTTEAVSSATDLLVMFDFPDVSARWVRVKYTRTSGDGICDVYLHRRKV